MDAVGRGATGRAVAAAMVVAMAAPVGPSLGTRNHAAVTWVTRQPKQPLPRRTRKRPNSSQVKEQRPAVELLWKSP